MCKAMLLALYFATPAGATVKVPLSDLRKHCTQEQIRTAKAIAIDKGVTYDIVGKWKRKR